jgi:L-ascorbate metabolism protein UlaG (beta-lactamase superfamily)
MKIKWLGHSCFKVEHNGYSLVLDPYKDSLALRLKKMSAEANEVLTSHDHQDHNYVEAVKFIKTDIENPFTFDRLLSYHDNSKGQKRGENFITIIRADGLKIAHLGDLGCALAKSQIDALQDLDALMIPVGGFFTIGPKDAKEICDILDPKVIIPMHYKGKKFGPLVLSKIESFTKLFNKKDVKNYKTDTIEITKDMQKQVALLTFKI